MYEAFDPYLRVDTWHSGHPADDERFYRALATIVRHPDFDPDAMGTHMVWFVGKGQPLPEAYDKAIAHRVTEAWAIRDYLRFGL